METEPKVAEKKRVYSPEKNKKVSTDIVNIRTRAYSDAPQISDILEKEIKDFAGHLQDTYGKKDVSSYAMWHALGGSTINQTRESEIEKDDFPGEDSVEKFVNNLMEKYK